MHGYYVCNFVAMQISWCSKCIRMMMYVSSVDRFHYMHKFSIVSGYHEDLKKNTELSKWGLGTCVGMGACPGQYGTKS